MTANNKALGLQSHRGKEPGSLSDCKVPLDLNPGRSCEQKKKTSRVPAVAPWINDPACLCGVASSIPSRIPSPAQWVKGPVLTRLRRRWQMRFRFNLWPGEFPYASGAAKKRKCKYK